MEHITKISKLFKDSTASKFAITKLIGVNDLSVVYILLTKI